ncbi:MAG: hypothetical protein FJ104_03855 [Deltaproteobacteria bacterium]|nr:hypothetical protein [Deltaproteobacteria bacterium]
MTRILPLAATLVAFLSVACGDPPPKQNPFEVKKDTVEPPPMKEAPKPEGPPEFSVAADGPKVGYSYLMLGKPEGKEKLASAIREHEAHVRGKTVPLRVDRKARLAEVAEVMRALETGGAAAVSVSTDTRPEFPRSVAFAPRATASSARDCSVVAKVLSERKNAVWSVRGGTAVRSPKGLAGPDMAMTGESLANAARRCKDSSFVFVSADPDVEWGLVYDLAAATQVLEKVKLDKVVLLEPSPTAGRPVKLD